MSLTKTQGITEPQLAKEIWGSIFGSPQDYQEGWLVDRPERGNIITFLVIGILLLAAATVLSYFGAHTVVWEECFTLSTFAGIVGFFGLLSFVVGSCKAISYSWPTQLSDKEALQWLDKQEQELDQMNNKESLKADKWRAQLTDGTSSGCHLFEDDSKELLENKAKVWDVHYNDRKTRISAATSRFNHIVN